MASQSPTDGDINNTSSSNDHVKTRWSWQNYAHLISAYFFTTWATRMDEWSISLILSVIFPSTLLFISIYAFSVTLSAICFGQWIGIAIDKIPRWTSLNLTVVIQKLSSTVIYVLFATSIITGAIMRLANIGTTISVEKDWIVVLCEHDKMILTTPIFVSLLTIRFSIPLTFIGVTILSVVTTPIEIFLYRWVYVGSGVLSLEKSHLDHGGVKEIAEIPGNGNGNTGQDGHFVMGNLDGDGDIATPNTPAHSGEFMLPPGGSGGGAIAPDHIAEVTIGEKEKSSKRHFGDVIRIYVTHPMFMPSFALSLLYMTTLAFANVQITYLLAVGYSNELLAGMRTLAVIMGVLATITITPMITKIGLVRTGLWSIWSQTFFIAVAVGSFFLSGFDTAVEFKVKGGLLFAGTIFSRWGLWSFDLAVTQMMQESISEDQVGIINGAMYSLQNFFEMLSYVITIIWSTPDTYYISAIWSGAAVLIAAIVYSVYARQTRGHLVHLKLLHRD
ncbi:hypothetical protein HDU76_013755 [Blyttiomyces sp. JEL0837]|nr:hypothetical protein HDU76_013755 [Blyttiomyces sp. JEL0837]